VLSFEKLTKENKEIIAEKLTFGDGCKELFEDIISMCEECGYTASVTSSLGSVVVLIYNGEGYSFIYPDLIISKVSASGGKVNSALTCGYFTNAVPATALIINMAPRININRFGYAVVSDKKSLSFAVMAV